MKTMKQVLADNFVPAKLVRGVVRQLGSGNDALESLQDVYEHGADGGFHGFIYHSDTVAFYKRHRKDIVEFAESLADESRRYFGEDIADMIMNFGCFKGKKHDSQFKREVMHTLYGRVTDTNVANAMAWFVLEEVARQFCD